MKIKALLLLVACLWLCQSQIGLGGAGAGVAIGGDPGTVGIGPALADPAPSPGRSFDLSNGGSVGAGGSDEVTYESVDVPNDNTASANVPATNLKTGAAPASFFPWVKNKCSAKCYKPRSAYCYCSPPPPISSSQSSGGFWPFYWTKCSVTCKKSQSAICYCA